MHFIFTKLTFSLSSCHSFLWWLIEAFDISSVIWLISILQYFESCCMLKLWLLKILNSDSLLKSILLIWAKVISSQYSCYLFHLESFQTLPLQLVYLNIAFVSHYTFLTLKIITFSTFHFCLLIILNMAWLYILISKGNLWWYRYQYLTVYYL